jgi:hypothetical protein
LGFFSKGKVLQSFWAWRGVRLSPFIESPAKLHGFEPGAIIPLLPGVSAHAPMARGEISIFLRFSRPLDRHAAGGDESHQTPRTRPSARIRRRAE